jgi:hypothetical protein
MVQSPFTIFKRPDLNQAEKFVNQPVTFVPI